MHVQKGRQRVIDSIASCMRKCSLVFFLLFVEGNLNKLSVSIASLPRLSCLTPNLLQGYISYGPHGV